MLQGFEPRLYQETILHTCVGKNVLVVLPTGMGKTAVAMMLAAQRLKMYPGSKVVVLAPTKPLVEQHKRSFSKHFSPKGEGSLVVFTGNVRPDKREALFQTAQVIFSTPQGFENDVISGRIAFDDVSLLVLDECHRAVGDYSYVYLAKEYDKKARRPRILGLTASPGSELEKIEEVCRNLFIEAVEIRTDKDPDVKPYLQEVDTRWVRVTLPEEFLVVKRYIEASVKSKIEHMKRLGVEPKSAYASRGELLGMQRELHARLASGERDMETMKCLSLVAEAMKAQHALELLESQGITALKKYFDKLYAQARTSKTKAVQNLARDLNFKSAFIKATKLFERGVEHPKLDELGRILGEEVVKGDVRIILFTQYRDTAAKIKERLGTVEGVKAEVFVGQAKKGGSGLSQKKQIEMLDRFREGQFNTLVATSVAEEGLDIPAVDLVMFYEPIPSAIRSIQRRGRTGRQEKGRVIVLMASGTRDEGYHWSAKHKEKKMYRFLDELRSNLNRSLQLKRRSSLMSYSRPVERESLKVFADYREKGSAVLKGLLEKGVNMKLEMLACADFVISSKCGIEYKTCEDFVDSLIDGRLLSQLKELKASFERPLILVEGQQDIYAIRKVHPNAIRGMLATIALSYGIPILFSRNAVESADIIEILARREQEGGGKEFSLHASRKPRSLKEQQEYVVGSLPSVGPSLAKVLLEHFGSVRAVMGASESELKAVPKIGDKKAEGVKRVLDDEYKPV